MPNQKVIELLREVNKEVRLTCYCGSSASLCSNSVIYGGKEYGNGLAWVCNNFPACRGSVGCHKSGKPLGTIVDNKTKKIRIKLHSVIDPLWEGVQGNRQRKAERSAVYKWLSSILSIEPKDCHVGMFSYEQCVKALSIIESNPYSKRKINEDVCGNGISSKNNLH